VTLINLMIFNKVPLELLDNTDCSNHHYSYTIYVSLPQVTATSRNCPSPPCHLRMNSENWRVEQMDLHNALSLYMSLGGNGARQGCSR